MRAYEERYEDTEEEEEEEEAKNLNTLQ